MYIYSCNHFDLFEIKKHLAGICSIMLFVRKSQKKQIHARKFTFLSRDDAPNN